MRNSVQILLLLLLSVLLTLAKAQSEDAGEKEESNIPRKVLRKYRIRRPNIVDENGNAVTTPSVPRLRRIRINKPQVAQPQIPSSNSIDSGNVYNYNFQEPRGLSFFEEQPQQVIEPVRVVPMYRKATPSSTRSALLANVNLKDRGAIDDDNKKQPIGTTRNFSRINEDGSFTFGYEGEDGSFKEETRGIDCVVRGKYGYVDPDGVQREFAYVSGNPCDPNDPDKDVGPEEFEEPPRKSPISRPRRPIITQDVQQSLEQAGTEEVIPPAYRLTHRQRVQTELRPQFPQPTTFRPPVRLTQRTQLGTTSTPPSTFPSLLQLQGRSVQTTFQRQQPTFPPFSTAQPILEQRGANKAFDFEQELQRIQGQRPQFIQQQQQLQPYSQQQPLQQHIPQFQPPTLPPQRFGPGSVHRFPHRQYFGGSNAANILQEQPTPTSEAQHPAFRPARPVLPQPILPTNSIQEDQGHVNDFGQYRTELVFDPSSGRYTSVLVQAPQKQEEQFTLTQRLRGFVEPKPEQFHVQMFPQPQIQYYNQHQLQQQPATNPYDSPFFRSQSGYQPGTLPGLHADAQEVINSPATGQIDAFLSNLNIRS